MELRLHYGWVDALIGYIIAYWALSSIAFALLDDEPTYVGGKLKAIERRHEAGVVQNQNDDFAHEGNGFAWTFHGLTKD